jgi:hypothetical protein
VKIIFLIGLTILVQVSRADGFMDIVDYYEAPARVAVESLPQAMQNRYSPTGKIICEGLSQSAYSGIHFTGSAQLSLKNNLITTVGHILIDTNNGRCIPKSRAENCKFIIKTGEFRVEKLIGTGITCPHKTAVENDWAVMKLKTAIVDIEPYPVDEDKISKLKVHDLIVTVAHSVDFKSPGPTQTGPKHFSECTVLNLYGGATSDAMSSACGCSEGCSGGSLLSPESRPSLLGIWTASMETLAQARRAQAAGSPNVVHWEEDGNGSYYRLLTDDFLEALIRGSM